MNEFCVFYWKAFADCDFQRSRLNILQTRLIIISSVLRLLMLGGCQL